MPNANIFAQFGLFVRRGFLDAEACRLIRDTMASATRTRALVRPVGQAAGVVDEQSRRTDVAEVPAATATLVADRLRAIQPEIAQHFRVQLSGCETLRFYIYEVGDFFAPHLDTYTDPLAPENVKARQVSISIFLNDGIGGPGCPPYSGGALVLSVR